MTGRITRYVQDVQRYMSAKGHASNLEILKHLQATYPDISATTVHRITSRLVERKKLIMAPAAKGNVMRFDITTTPHDHFMCSNCDTIRDALLPDSIRPLIEQSVGNGCHISGNLVITGLCKNCNKEEL